MTKLETILLVEDHSDDVVLTKKACAEAGIEHWVHAVCGGDEALLYLQGEGEYAERSEYPLPTLLLLDLRMPGKDGFSVLNWLNERPELRSRMVVVVLSAATSPEEVRRAYELGANSFLSKPLKFEQLVEVLRVVKDYWLRER